MCTSGVSVGGVVSVYRVYLRGEWVKKVLRKKMANEPVG